MHNPFVLLSAKLLDSLIKSGHTFFVRQTYQRGIDSTQEPIRAAFLLTHYSDLISAETHFFALPNDPNRFLYDAIDPAHYQKLATAAEQPSGYKVYSPLMLQPWKPPAPMARQIRNYISEKMNWTPGRSDGIKADLFTQFGELFINLKYKNEELKVPLADIEKF
jgi:hypothetical protein